MKTIFIVLAAALFCNSLAVAGVNFPIGPADVNITGVSQDLNYRQIRDRTNSVGTNTDFNFVYKSTTTNFTINSDTLLALLTNSFHTNFPSGAKLLLLDGATAFSFGVSDSTGTNVFFNPQKVLPLSPATTYLFSGGETDITTNSDDNVPFIKSNDTESYSAVVTFTYDDSAMTNTVDGTHTKFSWTGFAVTKFSENYVSEFTTENITMTIIGSGSIRGQPAAIFTGTIRAKLSN